MIDHSMLAVGQVVHRKPEGGVLAGADGFTTGCVDPRDERWIPFSHARRYSV